MIFNFKIILKLQTGISNQTIKRKFGGTYMIKDAKTKKKMLDSILIFLEKLVQSTLDIQRTKNTVQQTIRNLVLGGTVTRK